MRRAWLPFSIVLDADCITFYAADICALIVYSAFNFEFVIWAIGIWRMSVSGGILPFNSDVLGVSESLLSGKAAV
jgi:hypothetical protein